MYVDVVDSSCLYTNQKVSIESALLYATTLLLDIVLQFFVWDPNHTGVTPFDLGVIVVLMSVSIFALSIVAHLPNCNSRAWLLHWLLPE